MFNMFFFWNDKNYRHPQCFHPSVLWCCWLGGRKGIRPVKTEWWATGMVICLEWGANDLHMLQKNPEWFTFLVPAYPGCPGKRLLNGCSSLVVVVHEWQKMSIPSKCTFFSRDACNDRSYGKKRWETASEETDITLPVPPTSRSHEENASR